MASEWMPKWTILITLTLIFIATINFLFAGISMIDTSNENNNATDIVSTTVKSLTFDYITYQPARWIITTFFWILVLVDIFLAWGWISSLLGRS
jgi:hypothetical protein